MNRLCIAALLILLAIPGCAKYVWVHPDKGEAEFNKDKYQCLQEAGKLFPPQFVTKQVGSGYQSPSTTNCYQVGTGVHCETTPGQYTPPSTVTEDANRSNRNEAFESCMKSNGWSLMRVEQ